MDTYNMDNPIARMIQIQERAKELMDEYELHGWRFEIASTKRAVGRCFFRRRVIEFSKYYIESPWHDIENTLRHEIAHALVYIHHGEDEPSHGRVWQAYAIAVGAAPKSCTADAVSNAKHNYAIKCTGCGRVWKRHRLKAGYLNGRFKSNCCSAEMEVYQLA
jgi:predicted SprT family Zn-dependent metalloprotease